MAHPVLVFESVPYKNIGRYTAWRMLFMTFGKAHNAVFRNPSTRKWIGLVMCNKRSNIIGDSDEKVEYLNLNFKEDAPLYNQKGVYHPYKKQNKHWIVILMDETLSDEEIMDLVAIGYENSCK